MALWRLTTKVISTGRQPTVKTITHCVAVQTGTCSVAVQTEIIWVKSLEPVKLNAVRIVTNDPVASVNSQQRREASPSPSTHCSRSASVDPASGAGGLDRRDRKDRLRIQRLPVFTANLVMRHSRYDMLDQMEEHPAPTQPPNNTMERMGLASQL